MTARLVRRGVLCSALLTALIALPAPQACAAANDEPEAEAEEPVIEGVLLGRFYIRDIYGAEGAKVRMSFALYAAVTDEAASDFRAILSRTEARVKDEVLTAVRMSRLRDFQEPELERFRRRILMRLRRTAPRLAIERLLIGEFEFFVDQR